MVSYRESRMINAANTLARFNGLSTTQDLSRLLGSDVATSGSSAPTTRRRQDPLVSGVVNDLIDVASGAFLTNDVITRFNNLITDATEDQRNTLKSLIEIYYGRKDTDEPKFDLTNERTTYKGIRDLIIQSNIINASPRNPTKLEPAMSVYVSNHQYVSPVSRHINPIVIFLNSIPNLEVARSMPFVDIKFFHPRAPLTSENQLQAPGLLRFLVGADTLNSNRNADFLLATANSLTGSVASTFPQADTYSVSGMEMFLSPMTLVNADERDNPTVRGNPVIDRLRPFMSFKDLELTVVPTGGMMSYKSGRLTFTLHDRSRMSEIADFIKADLYSASEIEIEYGWIHPDGVTNNNENPYADIINGMRLREKYGIVNSSFTFDESGQVNITLQIAMRGGTDMSTELIGNFDEAASTSLRRLQELQELVSTLRGRLFNETEERAREVRGVQFLDTIADATPTFRFTTEIVTQLTALRRTLQNTTNPDASRLREALENMIGPLTDARGSGTRSSPGGTFSAVRNSIIEAVRQKIAQLSANSNDGDPFLRLSIGNNDSFTGLSSTGNRVATAAAGERNELQRYTERYGGSSITSAASSTSTSLANILLHFVGQPLAATGKYDEIQFMFYPFNQKAGYANRITTAAFAVDLAFFGQELVRQRFETAGHNQIMSIRDFFNFLQSTIVDDPAAFSYGLWDRNGALYESVITDEETREVRQRDEPPQFQTRLQNILRAVTPDAEFTMPQLEVYVECLPGKTGLEDGESTETDPGAQKSILRIHVFDRAATPYESVGQIMRASRDAELGVIGRIPAVADSATNPDASVTENNQRIFTQFMDAAIRIGLVEKIDDRTSSSGTDADSSEIPPLPTYRVAGGQRALKAFLYESLPYVIYGAQGTALKTANLSSMQNPELSTVNMLRSPLASNTLPNGEQPGGLPMSIIPTELTLPIRGCPLINFAQQFFVDFQTGTTADNIYGVTGITHKISQGEFNTDVKFGPLDAYGTYRNIMDRISTGISLIRNYEDARTSSSDSLGEEP